MQSKILTALLATALVATVLGIAHASSMRRDALLTASYKALATNLGDSAGTLSYSDNRGRDRVIAISDPAAGPMLYVAGDYIPGDSAIEGCIEGTGGGLVSCEPVITTLPDTAAYDCYVSNGDTFCDCAAIVDCVSMIAEMCEEPPICDEYGCTCYAA